MVESSSMFAVFQNFYGFKSWLFKQEELNFQPAMSQLQTFSQSSSFSFQTRTQISSHSAYLIVYRLQPAVTIENFVVSLGLPRIPPENKNSQNQIYWGV